MLVRESSPGSRVMRTLRIQSRPAARVGNILRPAARRFVSFLVMHNGRELFYRNGTKVMAVDIKTSPEFAAGKPKVLFEGNYGDKFDVSPDGSRFLMNKLPTLQQTSTDQLTVVVNWFEE